MVERYIRIDDKYKIVAGILENVSGRLLDVGARDRVLEKYLSSERIAYFSADVSAGHDFQFDLDQPIPLDDRDFDYVVALDVLEHVENIHQAFSELARITSKKLIIALPNMATISKRWSYFWRGHIGTAKYDLLPKHQGDRHRWFTVYPQINNFIEKNSVVAGLSLVEIYEELEKYPLVGRLFGMLARIGWLPGGVLTDRCIYVLARTQDCV